MERIVGEYVAMLFRSPIPGGTPGDQSQDGSVYILPRIFNPGMTDDVGTYRCRAIVDTPSGDLFLVQTSEVLQIKSN